MEIDLFENNPVKSYFVQYHQDPSPAPETWRKKWITVQAENHTQAACNGLKKNIKEMVARGVTDVYALVTQNIEGSGPPEIVAGKIKLPHLLHCLRLSITPREG